MRTKKLILSTIILFTFFIVEGQKRCGTKLNLEWLRTNAPDRYQRFLNAENFTKNYINNSEANRLISVNGVIIIPVVVHVLHRGELEGSGNNISIAQIQSQIAVLNDDFRRLNADAVNTPSAFLPVASDLGIEFRLACIDPYGNSTNGIVRKYTNTSFFIFAGKVRFDDTPDEDLIEIKREQNGSAAWPTDRYLNIWVCNILDVLGYSTKPADYSTYPQDDGIVIKNTAFGRTGSAAPPSHKGRTATHEIGHWLSIKHVWGDIDDNQACLNDDLCNDTPQQKLHSNTPDNNGCPTYPDLLRRCNISDPSTMYMNYMDFVRDDCMNLFTNDQKSRARSLFASGGLREQQLNNWFKVRQSVPLIRCTGVVYSSPMCLNTTWTVLTGPATLTPGPGVNQATLQATGTGTVVIRATSGNYTTDDNIEVTNVPASLTGTYSIISNYHSVGTQYPLGTNNGPVWLGANQGFEVFVHVTSPDHMTSSSTWTRSTNSYPFTLLANGSSMSFSGTSGSTAYQSRNGIFNFTAPTSCGTFNGTYTWPVMVAGWLRIMVSPNPATDNIIVSIDEKESKIKSLKLFEHVTITLHDLYTNISVKKWEFRNSQNKFYLNVSDLKKGHYVLILRRGKDQGVKQILIE